MQMYYQPQNQTPQGYYQTVQNQPVFAPVYVTSPNISYPPPSLQQNMGPPTYQMPTPTPPFVYTNNDSVPQNSIMTSEAYRHLQQSIRGPIDSIISRGYGFNDVHQPQTLQKKPNASLLAFNENDELVPRTEGMQPATADRFQSGPSTEKRSSSDTGISDCCSVQENKSELDVETGETGETSGKPPSFTEENFPMFGSSNDTSSEITSIANCTTIENTRITFAEKAKANQDKQQIANQNNVQIKSTNTQVALERETVENENVEIDQSPSSSTPLPIQNSNPVVIRTIIDDEEYFDAMEYVEQPKVVKETKKTSKKKTNEWVVPKPSNSRVETTPKRAIEEEKPKIQVKNRFDLLDDN
ncbi:unnamed protein product [Caenorhabditis angaria]|uniref:Uncharacterized protein n=1 Tax=Caenorhabditis angaria TaxID=860376 RepID=A0A9P1J4V0_9PELO|nr:unnamed protein product [Caenorhabditis angaria]